MAEKEKGSISITENVEDRPPSRDSDFIKLPEPGSAERILAERKLVRKLDFRLLPTIFLIFIMNYIDVSCVVSIFQPIPTTTPSVMA